MIVQQLNPFIVKSYDELWDLYLNDSIALNGNGGIPYDLEKVEPSEDVSDGDLIKSLLAMDDDNFYHVSKVDGYYQIFTVGFAINKQINEPIREFQILMGEDGRWQNGIDALGEDIFDASLLGKCTLYGENVEILHKTKTK